MAQSGRVADALCPFFQAFASRGGNSCGILCESPIEPARTVTILFDKRECVNAYFDRYCATYDYCTCEMYRMILKKYE